jgi:hypothetical protein
MKFFPIIVQTKKKKSDATLPDCIVRTGEKVT